MSEGSSRHPDLPRARVERRRASWWVWAFPLLAAGFVGWLTYRSLSQHGPTIRIRFENASGVEVDRTSVRFRGAKVGEVRSLELTRELRQVIVEVRLTRSAADLAREGTVFWIERPRISLGDIQGLNTIVSGEFIQARAGGGAPSREFIGKEEPPSILDLKEGLDLVLLAPRVGSLRRGSPVSYRGLQVGEVLGHGLGGDGRAIEVRLWIAPRYASLVGPDSKFWDAGGLDVDVRLLGAEVKLGSIRSLIQGGVEFATPQPLAEKVPKGMEFRLYERAADEWLGWAPAIPIDRKAKGFPMEERESGEEDLPSPSQAGPRESESS